ncbi:MAG: glycosyltransferase family 2 protein [Leptonema sp. (in: Bacteria)]|nr:glycosyltransferase family 2 protein [Leptonema sp. (in: bacteria)]
MSPISVTIITYNEEKNIADCIRSVEKIADEIIVLDSFSTDQTESIATGFEKVRFQTHSFDGHVQQKNRAITLCKNDWVLSLDADERLSSELAEEILKLNFDQINSSETVGFRIPRLTFHMGRPIRHSGWYPQRRYRLFKKQFSKWQGENPHDYIVVDGKGLSLKGDIIHYSFTDLTAQIETINKFSSIVAFNRYHAGRPFQLLKSIFKPVSKFIEIYIFKLGFLDGFPGFTIALASAFSTFLKFAKIFEIDRNYIERPSNLRADYQPQTKNRNK